MIGSTGAMKPDTLDTTVVFMYLVADAAPGAQHLVQRAIDAGAFLLFALDERDALAVFAQPRQHVAQLRLGLVLVLGNGDEAAADQQHRPLAITA